MFIYRVRLPAGAESGFVLGRIHACAKINNLGAKKILLVGFWGGFGVVGLEGRASCEGSLARFCHRPPRVGERNKRNKLTPFALQHLGLWSRSSFVTRGGSPPHCRPCRRIHPLSVSVYRGRQTW